MTASSRAYKVGYARVSTPAQKLDSQWDVLSQVGCGKIFSDHVSGRKAERPGWDQLMAYVRPGDTVVVTELSRMSRSLMHLLDVVREFEKQGYLNRNGAMFPGDDGRDFATGMRAQGRADGSGTDRSKSPWPHRGAASNRPGQA